MSAHELAVGIHPDRHFFPVLVYDRVIAFLAFASILCDAKNLIVPSFFLDSGLRREWQVLHVYGSLFLRQRGRSENEASTDRYCGN
jgi:hypothetical protein